MKFTTLFFSIISCLIVTCSCVQAQTAQAESATKVEAVSSTPSQAQSLLQKGDRLVILGDSISAMCKYTVLVDLYLAACRPDLEIWMYQDAISGEVTAKQLRRLDVTLERTRPTAAISFYGVNDAGWSAFNQDKADQYDANTRELLQRLKAADIRVLLASTSIMGDKLKNSVEFNKTLSQFRDITEHIASDTQTRFTDVHTLVHEAQNKMRARAGESPTYDIIARDGAHADWQGHMAIATAMLRGLGMGQEPIAQIVFDQSEGKATASDGHRIVKVEGDTLTVESSRYPFYFLWDSKAQPYQDMPKVAEEIGFFDDLNRFMLVAKGLEPGTYNVTWDKMTKPFTAQQLEAGVNLAKEFQRTPFDAVLYKLWLTCLTKATMDVAATIDATYKRDTIMVLNKQIAAQLDDVSPEQMTTMLEKDPMEAHDLYVKRQRDLVKPVSYQIRITPQ